MKARDSLESRASAFSLESICSLGSNDCSTRSYALTVKESAGVFLTQSLISEIRILQATFQRIGNRGERL